MRFNVRKKEKKVAMPRPTLKKIQSNARRIENNLLINDNLGSVEKGGRSGGTQRPFLDSGNSLDCGKKRKEFLFVKLSIGTDATANIESVRSNLSDRVGDVRMVQPSGKEERDRHRFADAPTDVPVVLSSGPSENLDSQIRIPRIEQYRIDVGRNRHRLGDGFFAENMDNLHESNSRKFGTELPVRVHGNGIDELEGVDVRAPLLGDNRWSILFAREEKRCNAGGDSWSDLGNERFRDRSGSARHFRDQPDRRGAIPDGKPRLILIGDAADFDARGW
jgi:hypothetical protein